METKEYFYYKINISSPKGNKMRNFIEKGYKIQQETMKLAEDLGAISFTECPKTLFPGTGIGSLIFKSAQSSKKYKYIGKRSDNSLEYIPNMFHKKGKDIAKRIHALPSITGEDIIRAFSLSGNEKTTPSWFLWKKTVYIRSSYSLEGAEFTNISETFFRNTLLNITGNKEGA